MLITFAAERNGGVYPFREEDWLRYQLSTLWPADERLMLISGPSAVREGIDAEMLERAFPQYRVYNGAFSLGTVTDVQISLEYIEQRYGAEALPRVLVLGLSPRFLLDLPAVRPFLPSINAYSPVHQVVSVEGVKELRPKSAVEGSVSRARFLLAKQEARILGALSWWLHRGIGDDRGQVIDDSQLAASAQRLAAKVGPDQVREFGLYGALVNETTQYRLSGMPLPEQKLPELMGNMSWWGETHAWDPTTQSADVQRSVTRLITFARDRQIALVPVSMPARSIIRQGFGDSFEAEFATLLDTLFPMPVLDARCLLNDAAFYDLEHVRRSGARQLTARVIQHLNDVTSMQVPVSFAPRPSVEACAVGATDGR
ncbi:MAG: hypothetical protein AAGH83_00340 [Pseudomonadota bacterium]